MTKLLTDTGRALYGDRWQSAIARDLQVSDRTVRRWVAGDDKVPDGAYLDLHRLAYERLADLEDVVERLKVASAPAS